MTFVFCDIALVTDGQHLVCLILSFLFIYLFLCIQHPVFLGGILSFLTLEADAYNEVRNFLLKKMTFN